MRAGPRGTRKILHRAGELERRDLRPRDALASARRLPHGRDRGRRGRGLGYGPQDLGSAVEACRRGDGPFTKQRLARSIALSERLILIDPTDSRYGPPAANALGLVIAPANLEGDVPGQDGRLKRVAEIWRELVNVDPSSMEARAGLGRAVGMLANFYDRAERVDEQIAALREQPAICDEKVMLVSNPKTLAAQADALIDLAYAIQSKD